MRPRELQDLLAQAYFETANAARAFVDAIDEYPNLPLNFGSDRAAARFETLRNIVRHYNERIPKSGPHKKGGAL